MDLAFGLRRFFHQSTEMAQAPERINKGQMSSLLWAMVDLSEQKKQFSFIEIYHELRRRGHMMRRNQFSNMLHEAVEAGLVQKAETAGFIHYTLSPRGCNHIGLPGKCH